LHIAGRQIHNAIFDPNKPNGCIRDAWSHKYVCKDEAPAGLQRVVCVLQHLYAPLDQHERIKQKHRIESRGGQRPVNIRLHKFYALGGYWIHLMLSKTCFLQLPRVNIGASNATLKALGQVSTRIA
jgi:hypothetical protein